MSPEGRRYQLGELLVSGGDVAEATAVRWPTGEDGQDGDDWAVDVSLTKKGTAAFESATTAAFTELPPRNQLALVVDGAVLFAPTVVAPIENGMLVISGLSGGEAIDLAKRLAGE